jgi:hypothetical protein
MEFKTSSMAACADPLPSFASGGNGLLLDLDFSDADFVTS